MIRSLKCSSLTDLIQKYLTYLLELLNMSLNFIAKSYFAVPKCNMLNSENYIIMKIQNKREFHKSHLISHKISVMETP